MTLVKKFKKIKIKKKKKKRVMSMRVYLSGMWSKNRSPNGQVFIVKPGCGGGYLISIFVR